MLPSGYLLSAAQQKDRVGHMGAFSSSHNKAKQKEMCGDFKLTFPLQYVCLRVGGCATQGLWFPVGATESSDCLKATRAQNYKKKSFGSTGLEPDGHCVGQENVEVTAALRKEQIGRAQTPCLFLEASYLREAPSKREPSEPFVTASLCLATSEGENLSFRLPRPACCGSPPNTSARADTHIHTHHSRMPPAASTGAQKRLRSRQTPATLRKTTGEPRAPSG